MARARPRPFRPAAGRRAAACPARAPRPDDQRAVCQRRQLDPPDAIREFRNPLFCQLRGHRLRDARLADAARAGDGDDGVLREQRLDRVDVGRAAEQRSAARRKVGRHARRGRRESDSRQSPPRLASPVRRPRPPDRARARTDSRAPESWPPRIGRAPCAARKPAPAGCSPRRPGQARLPSAGRSSTPAGPRARPAPRGDRTPRAPSATGRPSANRRRSPGWSFEAAEAAGGGMGSVRGGNGHCGLQATAQVYPAAGRAGHRPAQVAGTARA